MGAIYPGTKQQKTVKKKHMHVSGVEFFYKMEEKFG